MSFKQWLEDKDPSGRREVKYLPTNLDKPFSGMTRTDCKEPHPEKVKKKKQQQSK